MKPDRSFTAVSGDPILFEDLIHSDRVFGAPFCLRYSWTGA